MEMSTLHSSPLNWAFNWHRASTNQQHYNFQVRSRSYLLVAAAAKPSSSSSSTRPDFWVEDDDSEDDESEDEKEDPNELLWVRQARKHAIEAMSDRAFTDKDFEALLPAKLRDRNKKKKSRVARAPKKEDPLLVSIKARRKMKTQQKQISGNNQGLINTNLEQQPAEPIDPVSMQALVDKFAKARVTSINQVAENYRKLYGKPNEEEESYIQAGKQVPKVDFSVAYSSQDESTFSDGGYITSSDDDGGIVLVGKKKNTKMLEINLNQELVECRDVEEVLETVASASGRFKLSPINVSTALHRIAKHVVKLTMSESRRLRVARQKEMCELVALAMEMLSDLSAQGLSNIAWALSKVGGSLLYSGEMDLIARVALAKCQEMNCQNVANLAGAFAVMQHDSPQLFSKLSGRAVEVARDFKAQEVSQLLWAFASMDHPVTDVLDVLDDMLLEHGIQDDDDDDDDGDNEGNNFLSCMKIEDLASMAWSYAVFGQLQRPLFAYICDEVFKSKLNQDKSQTGEHSHACQLSQLHQASLSMKLEWKHLMLSFGNRVDKLSLAAWEKEKRGRKSTSLLQKDMERYLFYTGKKWIPEYKDADYSLDFALVDHKLGLEVNGPSHFSRNTGKALGHMILKRRILQASGWTILSASYQEWERLQTEEEQIDFVKNLISPHLEFPGPN